MSLVYYIINIEYIVFANAPECTPMPYGQCQCPPPSCSRHCPRPSPQSLRNRLVTNIVTVTCGASPPSLLAIRQWRTEHYSGHPELSGDLCNTLSRWTRSLVIQATFSRLYYERFKDALAAVLGWDQGDSRSMEETARLILSTATSDSSSVTVNYLVPLLLFASL